MKDEREIEKIAVHVLHDQRKRTLAEIRFARLAHGARRRIGPERFVIGAAIVITGQPESARRPQDQKRRRKQQPGRPPGRLRSEPTVRRVAENLRRIKRRKVVAEIIMRSLKRRPRRINDKRRQSEKHQQRLSPPHIGAHRLAEWTGR